MSPVADMKLAWCRVFAGPQVVRWILLYVTERVRREVTDAGVQQSLKDSYVACGAARGTTLGGVQDVDVFWCVAPLAHISYKAILDNKLTKYQTQVFEPSWLLLGLRCVPVAGRCVFWLAVAFMDEGILAVSCSMLPCAWCDTPQALLQNCCAVCSAFDPGTV